MYMGDTLNNLKRFSEAETAYKRALRLAPGVPELVTSLADCQQNMKKEREAVKNYRKALDVRPLPPACQPLAAAHPRPAWQRLERQLPRSPKAIRRLLARGPASGPEAEAAGVLLRALVGLWTAASSLCDWRDTDATLRRIRQLCVCCGRSYVPTPCADTAAHPSSQLGCGAGPGPPHHPLSLPRALLPAPCCVAAAGGRQLGRAAPAHRQAARGRRAHSATATG